MGTVTIDCRGLVKAFGGVRAVNEASLTFEAGKVTALLGPNGAGKTTLFHLLSGGLRLDRGQIHYRGRRIDGAAAWRVARWGIGRLFQDVRVFGGLTVLENVQVAFAGQAGENPAWAVLRRPLVWRQERALALAARDLVARVGLSGLEEVPAQTLSYGQQKLLALARLLAAGADVFLLD